MLSDDLNLCVLTRDTSTAGRWSRQSACLIGPEYKRERSTKNYFHNQLLQLGYSSCIRTSLPARDSAHPLQRRFPDVLSAGCIVVGRSMNTEI